MHGNILIRTCCSSKSGGGHLLRCLSLSKIFSNRYSIFLYCPKSNGYLLNNIISDYEIKILSYNEIIEKKFELCVIDDYTVNEQEFILLKKLSKKVFLIDENYIDNKYVDLIMNLTLSDKFVAKNSTTLLTDLKYLIIDLSFHDLSKKFIVKKNVKKLLINFGLSDTKSMTIKILKLINENHQFFAGIKFEVLTTSFYAKLEDIKEICSDSVLDFNLHINNFKTQTLIQDSDLIIGSGGMSLLERLTVGVPSITFSISKNQDLLKKKLHNSDYTFYINEESKQEAIKTILKVINDYELRLKMSLKCRKKFDGQGLKRVSKFLKKNLDLL